MASDYYLFPMERRAEIKESEVHYPLLRKSGTLVEDVEGTRYLLYVADGNSFLRVAPDPR